MAAVSKCIQEANNPLESPTKTVLTGHLGNPVSKVLIVLYFISFRVPLWELTRTIGTGDAGWSAQCQGRRGLD
jgi:hypothetical protein